MSDSSLFNLVKNGDEGAFTYMFDTYYAPLCLFAARYLKDIDQARSVVQQLFVDIWQKRERITIELSVKSYLYHSVKNRCIDFLRKKQRIDELNSLLEVEEITPFRDLIEESELMDSINKAVSRLPERCREVFTLCRFGGLKYTAVAERLNISVKTVEMQMGIALKKLRQELSKH